MQFDPIPQDLDIKKAAFGHVYKSTKTFGHDLGFSCAFRQWRAQSHCRFIHGYALKFHFEFAHTHLDERNWVVDFGSLKPLKGWLEHMFDHTLLVAEDDPDLPRLKILGGAELVQLRIVPATGCEAMARMVYEFTEQWLKDAGYSQVTLHKVSVHEHGANSAEYINYGG